MMDTQIYVIPRSPTGTKKYVTAENAPYNNLSIKQVLYSPDTASFESPEYYPEGTRLKIIGDHYPFLGEITNPTETINGYSYEAIDYSRRLFGKQYSYYKNQLPSTIIKKLLSNSGLPTNGIEQSNTKYKLLVWMNQKRLDIINQLAVLDGKEFYINPDGIPILRTKPSSVEGYIFTSDNVTDYRLSHDTSELITGVKVFGKDDTLLYTYENSSLIPYFGSIDEFINDTEISTKTTAKKRGDALINEKGRVKFIGGLTIPTTLPLLKKGTYVGFQPPSWSKETRRAYYIQSVTTNISDSNKEQVIEFLDKAPNVPDEWIYKAPNNDYVINSYCVATNTTKSICGKFKPSCTICYKNKTPYKWYYKCWVNKCPFCGGTLRYNPKKVPEAELTCSKCSADFCGVDGYEKRNPPRRRLTPSSSGTGATCTKNTNITVSGVNTPRQIRQWIDAHIKYVLYFDPKYSPAQVKSQGWGNCCDQSLLFVVMCQARGYQARLHKNQKCNGYSHWNAEVKINGRWIVADVTCSKLNKL